VSAPRRFGAATVMERFLFAAATLCAVVIKETQ